MSDYDSSSGGSQDNQNQQAYFKVFQHDFYLSASLQNIQQWKQNINKCLTSNQSVNLDTYLQLENCIFDKEEYHLKAAYHIRFYSFGLYLRKAFQQIVEQYQKTYSQQNVDMAKISQLDKKVVKLTFYLQRIELSRAASYIQQFDQNLISQIYNIMQTIYPYLIDSYSIWRTVMFVQIMNTDKSTHIMNIPFNMPLQYYLKTFKTLKFKHKQLTKIAALINPQLQKKQYMSAFTHATQELCKYKKKFLSQNKEEQYIDQSLLCEFLCCLKYMHFSFKFTDQLPKNLYLQYIFSSLKVPYYGKTQNMPVQYYEKLYLRILTQLKTQPKLIQLALYIDPNNVGQRSKQSFGKIQQAALTLCRDIISAQQFYLKNNEQPKVQYVKQLLNDQKFTLLIQFLQQIMGFNKSAFLKADNQIYEIFLQMAQFLKSAYLSFGKDLWLFPQNIFAPLTLGFFKKISEDINDDLKNILYQMVQNLNINKLPQKLVFQKGQFKIQNVTRLQYLTAIMYYIEDCSREQEYLNLPQVAPANFETSILMVKSIHVKFKHHEPNPAQLPLFIEYLRECQKYKLNINFKWFKNENYLSKSFERQTQFQIQSGLPCKQIQKHFRKCLNFRDRDYAKKLIEEDYNANHLLNAVQVASLLKYNHGMQNMSDIQNVKQQEIFLLLEQMQTMLAILPDDLFDLPLAQQINVSYLHLLLTFYCSKIKEAKGSDIYRVILEKVLLNYIKFPFSKSKQFREKYPKFFQRFIYQYHQIEVCATLNDLLAQFLQKYLPLSKNQSQWSPQQKSAVADLKQKTQIIRDQFLDKLQGSQQQISFFLVTFTSLISQVLPFGLYLECLRLFVKLVIKKPSLGQITSPDLFLCEQIYKTSGFFSKILLYLQDYDTQNTHDRKQVKRYILRHILRSSSILDYITFKQLMQLMKYAKQLLINNNENEELQKIYSAMNQVVIKNPHNVKSSWILAYILLSRYGIEGQGNFDMFALFDQQPQKRKIQNENKIKDLIALLKQFQLNITFWTQVRANLKDFKFKDFDFLLDFTYDFKDLMKIKQQKSTFEYVWLYFLKQLNDPSWTFYYMLKSNDPSLINIHQNRDQMLINLIKKQKLTKQSYPIFKNMISQTKNMKFILTKIMESYQNQQNFVQNYQFHNKLILINERFPDQKVQQCILRWIQVGENKLPLKIPQNYYISFIKKKLKYLTQNIAYDTMFKIHQSPEELTKLNKQIQKVFQILLYFPVKRFQNISLSKIIGQKEALKQIKSQEKLQQKQQEVQKQQQKTEQVMDDEGDWQQQDDDNEQVDIKKTEGKKQQKQQNKPQQQNQQQNNNNQDNNSQADQQNSQNSDNCYDDRPTIVQMFYEQNNKNQLQGYKQYCRIRQQIDIYLKSDYQKLQNSPIQDNQYLHVKLQALIKQLSHLSYDNQRCILLHMPQLLYQTIKKLGYDTERNNDLFQKLRKQKTKMFRIQSDLFSNRSQSDGSDYNDEDNYSSEGYNDSDDDQEDYNDDQQENQQMQNQIFQIKKKKNRKGSSNHSESDDSDIQLPDLTTQFSKVESQIKGHQLERKQIIKILQIFLVQIFKLTPINFKKQQIVFSYVQIMQSELGQVFFQSILTVLRMDENHNKNRKILLQKMKQDLSKTQSKFTLQQLSGFPQFSKYNGIVNFTYLLKALKQKDKYPNDNTNPFRKQSGTLLPIAQKCIIEFDLPIQTNVFSLVLLYIHSKSKLRDLLEEITVSYEDGEVKLTNKQIKRISEAFFRQKTHSSVWQYIESTINYKINDTDRLIISLDSYGQQVLKALGSSGLRIKQTIEKNNQIFDKKLKSQTQIKLGNSTHLKHYQRLYYITSNLLSSCSQQIKQFYFMNKQVCKYLWDDDQDNEEHYNYSKVPKKLLKVKQEIYTNQSFVHLLQLAFRIIYFVKKQLYGKISSKKFSRLIHYPKMIIQTATLYMNLSGQKGSKTNWNFINKKQVLKIIDNYQMGQMKFKNLTEVYNLILGLLQIEGFCIGKFKELLIPYFTKNKLIGLQAPLMFKVPEISDDVDGQNILITRQCSFDMALYQVNKTGLFVQFYNQQGSDHGGLIRQFMMGWKGVGFSQQDFFIGKILGISFKQSVPYGGYVDLQMCIKISNFKLTLENIEQIDKDIYNSLKYINENDPEDLGLTFSVMKKNPKSFEIQEFNLKPGGSQIAVTKQNKDEYIRLYLEKYYQVGREKQLAEVATGFYTVVYQAYAQIFKPHQLMQHIKGQQVCDINVIKSHVKYVEGYTQNSVLIKWLWEILQTYNQQQLNKFIQFLTGSPKLPIFNPNFQITIERVYNVTKLPVAHTCFNTLDLPQYPTKDILEKNLLTAIFQGNDNFGIL